MNGTTDTTQPTESQPTTAKVRRSRLKQLEIGLQLLAVALGFVHVWANHHYLINADAMSYLDIAEAYLRKDWHTAVNTYWGPLYSWVIALALLIARPSPYWRFAGLHLLNFGIYLFALGCFGLLIREIVRRHQRQRAELLAGGLVTLPDWALLALGYSLFIWSSLFLVIVPLESPDMLVAAFVYFATYLLLRMRREPSNWLLFFMLGIVLGLGFLAKSVMLPLALIFIIAAIYSVGNWRRALPRIVVTVAFFLLIAGPFVFAMSRAKGRLTTGQSGRLNYLWAINRVPNTHWQGEEPGSGTPEHPTRKIFDAPPTYEFGEPVGGTYPVWYDPTFWYEGSVTHFDLRQQVAVFFGAVKAYYELFHSWGVQYGLLVGLVALFFLGRRGWPLLSRLIYQWPLIIPAVAGLGLYLFVNVQPRYVASFIVLIWLALFSAVGLHHTPDCQRMAKVIPLILIVSIMFTTVASSSKEAILTVGQLVGGEDPLGHEQWQVAEGLRELGLAPSDRVAFIGDSFRAFWAYLLGLRVVAEVRRDKVVDFWQADATLKGGVINAFARTGAKAIVAEKPPPGVDLSGWQRIRQTDYYVHMLDH